MPFRWSLNPYMGCVHRCTFCYVRHFEQRADRPSDDRYGRSIRVKPNVADVLRRELARKSWDRDEVALGTATDPYQPAEGRFRLTRACLDRARRRRGRRSRSSRVARSSCATSTSCRRRLRAQAPRCSSHSPRSTSASGGRPSPAPLHPRAGSRRFADSPQPASTSASGSRRSFPASPTAPPSSKPSCVRRALPAREAIWASVVHLRPGVREHFLEALARDWPEEVARYEALFATRAYLPRALDQLDHSSRCAKHGLDGSSRARAGLLRGQSGPRQLALAV